MTDKYNEIKFESRLESGEVAAPFAVYVRISTDKQYMDRQIDQINNMLTTLPKNFDLVGEYQEVKSGKDFKRPEYKAMMGEVRAGRIKCVIVYDMTRFSRSLLDFHAQVKEFKRYNCELRLLKENITVNNSKNAMQDLILNVLVSVSQFEREVIAERTKDGMESKRKKNPFIVYGQKPKLVGEKLREFISMYYERRPASKRDSRRDDPFTYTLVELGNHFDMGKSSVSEFVSKHVTMGNMTHRSPDMSRSPKMPKISLIKVPKSLKKSEKDTHKLEAIFHAQYWPVEVRDLVMKKFGNGYEKGSSIKATEAFEFGRQSFKAWLMETVSQAMLGGELQELEPEQLERVCEELSFREKEPTEEEHQSNIEAEMMLDSVQDMSEEDLIALKAQIDTLED
jgi:DNA invertase Pin-like site-specific DNA recombinase